jgi:hypothetical protein
VTQRQQPSPSRTKLFRNVSMARRAI